MSDCAFCGGRIIEPWEGGVAELWDRSCDCDRVDHAALAAEQAAMFAGCLLEAAGVYMVAEPLQILFPGRAIVIAVAQKYGHPDPIAQAEAVIQAFEEPWQMLSDEHRSLLALRRPTTVGDLHRMLHIVEADQALPMGRLWRPVLRHLLRGWMPDVRPLGPCPRHDDEDETQALSPYRWGWNDVMNEAKKLADAAVWGTTEAVGRARQQANIMEQEAAWLSRDGDASVAGGL